jgi:putative DNA primase/helicase
MRAEDIAKALNGRKAGGSWMAPCPAHNDSKPSLSIRDSDDGKLLLHCHAGCDQRRVLAVLRSRGLWVNNGPRRFARSAPRPATDGRLNRGETNRSAAALRIWQAAARAEGTVVEAYLRSRGLHLPMPPSLRFHAGLRHPTGGMWPTMLALVSHGVTDKSIGIHRTFMARDGNSKAPVEPMKMMLGPCRGGAVRLGLPGDMLMVGEGIETCLAAMQATGHSAWAALSTAGLRSLSLPEQIRHVIVLADADEPGEAAARDCAWRWKLEGRRVHIARPPQGMDFNDVLLSRTLSAVEDAA